MQPRHRRPEWPKRRAEACKEQRLLASEDAWASLRLRLAGPTRLLEGTGAGVQSRQQPTNGRKWPCMHASWCTTRWGPWQCGAPGRAFHCTHTHSYGTSFDHAQSEGHAGTTARHHVSPRRPHAQKDSQKEALRPHPDKAPPS